MILTLDGNVNISEKVDLFKKLMDFNPKTEYIDLHLTGKTTNKNFGTDRVKYQKFEIVKDNTIKYDDMVWDVKFPINLEMYIHEK